MHIMNVYICILSEKYLKAGPLKSRRRVTVSRPERVSGTSSNVQDFSHTRVRWTVIMSGFLILAKNANTIKEVWDQMTKDNNDETIEKRKKSRLYGRHMEDIPPTPARVGKSCGLPQRVSIIMDSAPVSLSVAEQHGWNWEDKVENIKSH